MSKDIWNVLPYSRLQDNVILLGLGGSLAYGTDVPGSDVDIRGIALNSGREILLGKDFEQMADSRTDTVIYSFKKIVKLLADANPSVLELLFLDDDQYLYRTPIGRQLIEKRDIFLSQIAYYKFGGYARTQLGKLNIRPLRISSAALPKVWSRACEHMFCVWRGNAFRNRAQAHSRVQGGNQSLQGQDPEKGKDSWTGQRIPWMIFS